MVKFGKNKFKALNKAAKKQNLNNSGSNKILKKKLNADKKVTFQKEVLKEIIAEESPLVKNISAKDIKLKKLSKKSVKTIQEPKEVVKLQKVKSVEKRKKRLKTQANDTKLLLKLMKKK